MAERGIGHTVGDHRRIAKVVRDHERGLLGPGAEPGTVAKPRGLVRVMLLEDFQQPFGDIDQPDQLVGDFPLDARSVKANITESTAANFDGHVHYIARCVSAPATIPRTWRLKVIGPVGEELTEPISEEATADEVRDAINATGCPPCDVFGSGRFMMDEDELVEWPARQWHIAMTDEGWTITTIGANGDGVPIALIPTMFAPTAFAEDVFIPYTRKFAVPTPGTFALCQHLVGLGLTLIDAECWDYVD